MTCLSNSGEFRCVKGAPMSLQLMPSVCFCTIPAETAHSPLPHPAVMMGVILDRGNRRVSVW